MQFAHRGTQSCAQVRRPKRNRRAEDAAQQGGADQTFPSELSPTDQKNQHRSDQESCAARGDKRDVSEKKNTKRNEPRSRAPPTCAAVVTCEVKKDERADQKVLALQ